MTTHILFFLSTLFLIPSLHGEESLMQRSLKYLSSDILQGRRAGSMENKMAVDYLANALKNLSVLPLGTSYQQEFTIFSGMKKDGENALIIASEHVPFEPLAYSSSGAEEELEMVLVGFGITIPENDPDLKYDDYKDIDVKNKMVVILTADPAVGNTQSLFRKPLYAQYQSLNYKLNNAINHGAKGAIIVQDPLSLSDPQHEPELYFNEQDGGGTRFPILAGMAKATFFREHHIDLLAYQKELAKTQKPNSFLLTSLQRARIAVHLKRETGRVSNVVGIIPGNDPILKKEVIVLGAHLDHLGLGGQNSMEPSRAPIVHNGADDNASGSSMLLGLAEKLTAYSPKRTILLAFFNGEEMGLLGSQHFVNNWPTLEKDYGRLFSMINFDMVGRFNQKVSLMGTGSAFEWNDILKGLPAQVALPIETTKLAVGSSDHYSFSRNKIPILFFTTGAHPDYHRSTDDYEKIDFASMEKISSYSFSLLTHLDLQTSLNFDPDFNNADDPSRPRGYGAHLGCIPMFGQPDEIVGVVCTGASARSPAAEAGIKEGDVVLKLGEIEIKNIYDLVFALKYYRAGDRVDLVFKRGDEFITKNVTLTTKVVNTNKDQHHCHFDMEL